MGKPFKPLPMEFLVDGRDSPPDSLTACFPRTARQAFGHYCQPAPLRCSISFLPRLRFGWCGVLAVVLLLVACALGAKP